MNGAIDDIFIVEKLEYSPGQVRAILGINKNSAIFEGHFPGQPVVPGACMVQLVKDILCVALDANIILKKAASIKFTNMITPDSSPAPQLIVTYKLIDNEDISVNAKITIGDVACFKLQATYTKL
jgi:3-hydroxyacyl-[acyl-carrier-protein] dehydratase